MKKRSLIAVLLSLCFIIGQAQTKISVQGGIGLNGITKNENYDVKMGYRFGIGVEFPFNPTWSLQTGVQLLNRNYGFDKGVEFTGINEEGNDIMAILGVDAKTNAIYIQVPIKVAAFLPINNNCGLQFSAGPYLAYGTGGKSSIDWKLVSAVRLPSGTELIPGGNTKLLEGYTQTNTFGKEGIKRIDLGLSLGLDFKYKDLFAGFGIEYGLLPIDKEFPDDVFKTILQQNEKLVSPHNYGIEIHVGYCLPLNK